MGPLSRASRQRKQRCGVDLAALQNVRKAWPGVALRVLGLSYDRAPADTRHLLL